LRDVADRMRIFQLAHPDLPRALAAGCWRPSVRSWPSGCPLGPMPPRFSVGTPAITGRWSGGRTGRYAASARVSGWSGGRPRRGTWPPRCTGIWPTSRRRCRTCSASCGRSGTCGTVRPTPAPGSRNCCPPPYRWTPRPAPSWSGRRR
jgi:hypothetical protein